MTASISRTLFLASLAAALMTMALVACTPTENGGGGVVAPPAPVTPAVVGSNCAIGQIFHATYGCLNRCPDVNRPANWGWVPSLTACVEGTLVTGTTVGKTPNFRAVNVQVNQAAFDTVLQNNGVCIAQGIPAGPQKCHYYSHSAYVEFSAPTAALGALAPTGTLRVFAGSGQPGQPNSEWFHTGGRLLTFAHTAPLGLTNGFAGFSGVFGTVRMVVDNGLPSNSYQMNFRLELHGVTFMTGTLIGY